MRLCLEPDDIIEGDPCDVCPMAFSLEMRAIGRCDGEPTDYVAPSDTRIIGQRMAVYFSNKDPDNIQRRQASLLEYYTDEVNLQKLRTAHPQTACDKHKTAKRRCNCHDHGNRGRPRKDWASDDSAPNIDSLEKSRPSGGGYHAV